MENSTLDKLMDEIRKRQLSARKEIRQELKLRMNEKRVTIRQGGQGRKRKRNDYRLYVWLKVLVGETMYWITLFYNDVDSKVGNPHTQFGRIQFWKNIKFLDKKKEKLEPWKEGEIGSPSVPIWINDSWYWYLDSKNAYDPDQRLYDTENYSAKKVVERFFIFLEENGEKNIRSTGKE